MTLGPQGLDELREDFPEWTVEVEPRWLVSAWLKARPEVSATPEPVSVRVMRNVLANWRAVQAGPRYRPDINGVSK